MKSGERIKISVVIPAWNASKTIVEAVKTCMDQSLPATEIIVVNDGSTDNTLELLRQHFGNKIKLVNLLKNSGPAAARNAGIQIAAGDYIAFHDADDLWHKDKLKIISGILASQPEVNFLYHPYTLKTMTFDALAVDKNLQRFPWWKLAISNPIGTPCVVLKNHDQLRFDESMHHMEDLDLWLREGYTGGIWKLSIPLTQVQRPILSAGGQSSNRWKMRMGELKAFAKLGSIHKGYLLLWPFLAAYGLGKHLLKSFRPPRSNY